MHLSSDRVLPAFLRHTFHTDKARAVCRSLFLPNAAHTAAQIGLGVVNGDTTIARMDSSGGRYYVTNDPNCKNPITSSAYTTTFSYLYICGQCKGGCAQVDGGEEEGGSFLGGGGRAVDRALCGVGLRGGQCKGGCSQVDGGEELEGASAAAASMNS